MRRISLLTKIMLALLLGSGGLILLCLGALKLYGYYESIPKTQQLHADALAEPTVQSVVGGGDVRLTVAAEWKFFKHRMTWVYETTVSYREAPDRPWEMVFVAAPASGIPDTVIDAYRLGEQVLLAHVRNRAASTNWNARLLSTPMYLRQPTGEWQYFWLRFADPFGFKFYPSNSNGVYEHYERVAIDSTSDVAYNLEIWDALKHDMTLDERCWYSQWADAISADLTVDRREIEVVHVMQFARKLTLEFKDGHGAPKLTRLERVAPVKDMPPAPGEPERWTEKYVEPSVQRDLEAAGHPCAAYYQTYNLVRPNSVKRVGFLYPAF